jgi:hypothetical protein
MNGKESALSIKHIFLSFLISTITAVLVFYLGYTFEREIGTSTVNVAGIVSGTISGPFYLYVKEQFNTLLYALFLLICSVLMFGWSVFIGLVVSGFFGGGI